MTAPLPYRIMIADGGSEDTVADAVAAKKAQGSGHRVLPLSVRPDYAEYYAKLADALSRVTTPFVVMADNDDFFIPQGLARAVEFLHDARGLMSRAAGKARCSGSATAPATAPTDAIYGDRVQWKCSSQIRPTSPIRQGERLSGAASAPTTCFTLSIAPSCCEVISKRCATAIRVICS